MGLYKNIITIIFVFKVQDSDKQRKKFLTYFQEILTDLGIPCHSQNPYPTVGVHFTSLLLSNIA